MEIKDICQKIIKNELKELKYTFQKNISLEKIKSLSNALKLNNSITNIDLSSN